MPTSRAAWSVRPNSRSNSASRSMRRAKRPNSKFRRPTSAAGLITVERDHIYNAQWFKTTTTESVQKIKIPEELEGNGYITVTFLRSLDSQGDFHQSAVVRLGAIYGQPRASYSGA